MAAVQGNVRRLKMEHVQHLGELDQQLAMQHPKQTGSH
jgi:hypothetical protein